MVFFKEMIQITGRGDHGGHLAQLATRANEGAGSGRGPAAKLWPMGVSPSPTGPSAHGAGGLRSHGSWRVCATAGMTRPRRGLPFARPQHGLSRTLEDSAHPHSTVS